MDNVSSSGVSVPGSAEWWRVALTRLNNMLLRAPWLEDYRDYDLPSEDVERGWLGRPGASKADLVNLEVRLGIQLCPSYRALLQVSDGFGKFWRVRWQIITLIRGGLVHSPQPGSGPHD
jgi:hypothetical protein